MRLGILILACLLFTTPAWAYISPHGKYSTATEMCGRCHSLHRSPGLRLLRASTVEDTCLLCHDGTQSNYNVRKGTFFNGVIEVASPAGGFDPAYGYTTTHLVGQTNFIPGNNSNLFLLKCTSCHNPHGTDNHRNLQTRVNGVTGIRVIAQIAGPERALPTASGREVVSYQSGIVDFCTACHVDFKEYMSSDSFGGIDRWRHRVNVPLTGGYSISFPEPGLLTTLPTQGVPAGVRIQTASLTAGALNGTYNYLVTAFNALGESTRGNIVQVETVNNGVYLAWAPISNAVGYRVYRAAGSGVPEQIPVSQFVYLAEVGDDRTTFTDDGSLTPEPSRNPPVTAEARVVCLTCHFAHGARTVDSFSGYGYLRRLNNMGVCQNCHQK